MDIIKYNQAILPVKNGIFLPFIINKVRFPEQKPIWFFLLRTKKTLSLHQLNVK